MVEPGVGWLLIELVVAGGFAFVELLPQPTSAIDARMIIARDKVLVFIFFVDLISLIFSTHVYL